MFFINAIFNSNTPFLIMGVKSVSPIGIAQTSLHVYFSLPSLVSFTTVILARLSFYSLPVSQINLVMVRLDNSSV